MFKADGFFDSRLELKGLGLICNKLLAWRLYM